MTGPAAPASDSGPAVSFGNSDQTGTTESSAPATNGSPQDQAENPAWNTVWDTVSKHRTLNGFIAPIKETLSPIFKQWDADRQKLSQEYAPWKELGADPEKAKMGLQVFDLLENNPQYVYEYLQNRLGLSPQEAAQATNQAQQAAQQNSTGEQDSGEEVDPTIKALQQQMAEFQQERQQAQYESMVTQNRTKLEAGMTQLQEAHAKGQMAWLPFNPGAIAVFLKQQLFDAQQSGKPVQPDLKAAYDQWTSQAASIAGLQRNPAPRITPSGGGSTGLPLNQESGKIPTEVAAGRQSVFNSAAKDWIRNRQGS